MITCERKKYGHTDSYIKLAQLAMLTTVSMTEENPVGRFIYIFEITQLLCNEIVKPCCSLKPHKKPDKTSLKRELRATLGSTLPPASVTEGRIKLNKIVYFLAHRGPCH